MPRRNLFWLLLIALVSYVCYVKTPANRYGRTLADTLDHIERRYYAPIQDSDLFEGAMSGMIDRLSKDDRNSVYIPPVEARQFKEDIDRQFGGVGISVGLDPATKQLTVISPLPGTPAYEAGIYPGDKILRIDGQSTQGMSLGDAVKRMKGEPDKTVVLALGREGEPQPIEKTLVRKIIQEDTVQGDTRRKVDGEWTWDYFLPGHEHIGYIRMTGFAEAERSGEKTTVADLKKALKELADGGMRGLVLDLRDNPGGSLNACIDVCRLFLDPSSVPDYQGVILTTRGRDAKILRTYSADKPGPYTDFPMAILVNQRSASASEIVAACLQDYGRAVIVGQRSYGKGTVQEVRELGEDFGTLKLTIASFWRPSGRNIHRHQGDEKNGAWGVMPDEGCQVVVGDEEYSRFRRWRQDRDITPPDGSKPIAPREEVKPFVDRPLAKAVEYVEEESRK
jgi:carboxyl-terminal processing protease